MKSKFTYIESSYFPRYIKIVRMFLKSMPAVAPARRLHTIFCDFDKESGIVSASCEFSDKVLSIEDLTYKFLRSKEKKIIDKYLFAFISTCGLKGGGTFIQLQVTYCLLWTKATFIDFDQISCGNSY